MSANLPDSTPHLTSGREPLLANASQDPTPYQASRLPPPWAAGAASPRARYKKSGLGIVAALLLAITFWLYTQPDLVIMLAEQLWACF
jgi:type II secretory pathway component PulM